MPVPDYQTLMLPLLRRLNEQGRPTPVRAFLDEIGSEFQLTPQERAERIPSGLENLLSNRLAWARTYLGKAGLLSSPKRGVVEITIEGRELLRKKPERIDLALLRQYPVFAEWMRRSQRPPDSKAKRDEAAIGNIKSSDVSNETPTERIDAAQRELDAALRADILERVRRMLPSDFEELVVRLLLGMGYGDSQDELARELVGGSGDGGIDGIVHQDPLGLERVYVQAKRWKENNNVSSPDIRNFVGALNIHRATKGVFVTASEFTNDAKSAARDATMQVVLIDGEKLAELMVRHKVGVLVRNTIEIKEIDEGFFEE